ncbi:MAG: hypothetical protein M3Z08_21675 [Chloroflexota bacterium]|nr:hypothetical protein [Chloroflexota bacterium]
MSSQLAKPADILQNVPLWIVLVTCVVSVSLVTTFWLGWAIWLIAILIVLAWLPVISIAVKTVSQQSRYLGFFCILLITQGGHFIEHLAQLIQIYILGFNPMHAHGLIGTLDIEWVHFIWNSWVLIYGVFLLYYSRKNPWLWALAVIALWHEAEHVYIIDCYLKTGMAGLPGLLAHGGALWGGLPISRPNLHFLYALIEEGLIIVGYLRERRIALSRRNYRRAS